MEKMQWFKFSPADWLMGKIQRVPDETKVRFISLVCLYWNKGCTLTLEDAEIEVDKNHLDLMLLKKVVKSEEGMLKISFLDEQMTNVEKLSDSRKKAANARWENKTSANGMQMHKVAMQNDADKIREEEIRKDKKRREVSFTPPLIEDVLAYFKEKGYTEHSAIKAFEYYNVANWKDSKGNQVKSWKQKMHAVWFKDEHKISKPQHKPEKPTF